MTTLSIVIPVYNAEKTIESLCNTLIDLYGARADLEIVLVNDSSTDSSHIVCRRLQEMHREVITYVRLSRNFGEHNAVMAGLNHASGEFCLVMDDDFQNPPEEVGRLLAEIEKGFDVVYARYPEKSDGFFRNMGSRFNDRMANVILHKPVGLYLSSFKIMNRFLVDEITKYSGPDPYIDAIILRTTTNIGSIEARHDRRRHGRSGYTLGKLVSLWGNMMVSYSLVPLRIIGLAGFVITAIGIGAMGFALLRKINPRLADPTDIEQLSSSMAFFRGFALIALSVVGEYVGRIYLMLNRDPQFVVREKFSVRRKPAVMKVHKGLDGSGNEQRKPSL
ncbi:glycosyltransferase family 2 protein [Geomobilimonas luticola]|uniref:Glycosyltransferase family 2 protein n=1 Tax=Geomobilimonas luticola TaxID=1114878 RepID=A0ABS5SGR1_9BACT|nr:glycosyltransferase family 2 protein [Geomobilimonas luticola]MBT0653699.1 glycosyltransferase family 2 protein [Geomobilimonas luticola]